MPDSGLELVRGTLDLVILKALSWGPRPGVGVVRRVEDGTHQQRQVEEGARYPALHRLERRGWLEAEWGFTDRGRKAKYYQLTEAGRRRLAAELRTWDRYTRAIGQVIAAEGGTAR